jgi:hypothetical protein
MIGRGTRQEPIAYGAAQSSNEEVGFRRCRRKIAGQLADVRNSPARNELVKKILWQSRRQLEKRRRRPRIFSGSD